MFHAWKETGDITDAVVHVWEGRERARILATIICVALAFTAWNLFSAVSRRFAGGRLGAWLTRRESRD